MQVYVVGPHALHGCMYGLCLKVYTIVPSSQSSERRCNIWWVFFFGKIAVHSTIGVDYVLRRCTWIYLAKHGRQQHGHGVFFFFLQNCSALHYRCRLCTTSLYVDLSSKTRPATAWAWCVWASTSAASA
jgi:hypothetical protein